MKQLKSAKESDFSSAQSHRKQGALEEIWELFILLAKATKEIQTQNRYGWAHGITKNKHFMTALS